MDCPSQKLAELFQATLDPHKRSDAEEQLKQLEKSSWFAPTVLRLVMNGALNTSVRQAGVIYLKSFLTAHWSEPGQYEARRLTMQEQDRMFVRNHLIDAVVEAPPQIRGQLLVSIRRITRQDFPTRWSTLVPKLCLHLQSTDARCWPGAISALLELVNAFENRKGKERAALNDAMIQLMPHVQRIMESLHTLIQNPNNQQTELMMMQRLVLKVFFALSKHYLPLPLLGDKGQWESFHGWMFITCHVLGRRNPEMEKKPNSEEEAHLLEASEWWKTKKWSLRILKRTLKRYGSPEGVSQKHKEFSQHFVNTCPNTILDEVFKIINAFNHGHFVGEKVLQEAILYLRIAADHDPSWERLKTYRNELLTHFIFPLMCQCHTAEDERLWKEEPVEYIRTKFEESTYSVTCGEKLLNTLCEKEEILSNFTQIISQLLKDPRASTSPHWMDGVLHMVGAAVDTLLRKDQFKEQFEDVIMGHIFLCMESPHPFLRARAAWLISKLSLLRFNRDEVLPKVVSGLVAALCKNEEQLPVKVQAVSSIEVLILDQQRSHQYFQPYVIPLCKELLELLHKTENGAVTSALRKILRAFPSELASFANDMCLHLSRKFGSVAQEILANVGDKDDKINIATGLLKTMEAILEVMEKYPEICVQLEPVLLQAVSLIFDKSMKDFYENAFSLVTALTEERISATMWQVFEDLFRVLERDGLEYFVELIPSLHNYITKDTPSFLAVPSRLQATCELISKVLSDRFETIGEDAESFAAKLIEVMILQCRNHIRNAIPGLLELVMGRLARPILESKKLRRMCHQVFLASLYNDTTLTLISVQACEVMYQWIANPDSFVSLHDKKICVLGLSALIQTPIRPPALQQHSKEILPLFVSLFSGLKRAYAAKQSENSDTDEEGSLEDVVSTDEEETEEIRPLETIQEKVSRMNTADPNAGGEDEDDGAEEDDDTEDEDEEESSAEDPFEGYTTSLDDDQCPIDEYMVFKDVLMNVEKADPGWHSELTNGLTEEQRQSLQEIFALAEQRKSERIRKQGGFRFHIA